MSATITCSRDCCSSTESLSLCCQKPKDSFPWLKEVDLVCRVALGALAVYISPLFLTYSLALGTLIGGIYAAVALWKNREIFSQGEGRPVCAQGYMDFLSGMRFPPIIGNIATTAFIAAHLRHDPQFYVPFSGLFIGFWVGKEVVSQGVSLSRYFFRKLDCKPTSNNV